VSKRVQECFPLQLSAANNGVDPQQPPVYLDGTEAATVASFVTAAVWVFDVDALGVHFSTPGGSTLVGTLTFEVSNDRGQQEITGRGDAASLQNWVAISVWDWGAGAQAANKSVATGANQFLLGDRVVGYRWIRMRFAFTSGSGVVKAMLQRKGVS
jgi:hypothetical protein